MVNVLCQGEVFKLPTWVRGNPKYSENQLKLRYFVLTKDGTLNYYLNHNSFVSGHKPRGSLQIGPQLILFERINKVDFVLTTQDKRLWCRTFAESKADAWETALSVVGVMRPE
ncbi:hypothetical protein BASA81_001295 [Batrachochytrium salamandrivorans]|nr:hypothetical protein BASA81_001295 [Batrachochytrium salamandrivorans]